MLTTNPNRSLTHRPTGETHRPTGDTQPLTRPLTRRRAGYTLVEIVIVMTIISILISIAIPIYQKVVLRSRETVLRNNLFTIRTVIDEYTYDKQKGPQSLEDLVQAGYLRQIPEDPITRSNQTWKIIMEDALTSVNQTEPGIYDVRSGSDQKSLEGTPYADW